MPMAREALSSPSGSECASPSHGYDPKGEGEPAVDGSARWYAVRMLARSEGLAEHHLVRQGFEVFVPKILVTRRHARRLETVKAAFFPGYGFVRLDLLRHRWRSVNGTTGVANLVMGRDLPLAVPDGIVEALLARRNDDGVLEFECGFRPGDPVRLISGPFAGQLGILQSLDAKGRVEMLLSLIAGTVRVKVARDMLEPIR